MAKDEFVEEWEPDWAAAKASLAQWRREHARATMVEIEDAVDEQIDAMRARMLEGVAMESAAARFARRDARERPQCQACGCPLISRGEAERTLITTGEREVRLRRTYAHRIPIRDVGWSFPPR
jgi:hypothetical protein